MYDDALRARAASLLLSGLSLNATSKQWGVSRAAIREWRDNPGRAQARTDECPRCAPTVPLDRSAYAHLLGVYSLRITCDKRYPGLIAEARESLLAVRPRGRTYSVSAPGCVHVQGLWKHWGCLFPQHGTGRKHERRIELAAWQREIVEDHPGSFLRGLFHSDGCRVTNWTVRPVAGRPRRYEYPRYFFTNSSADIIGLCTWALDLLDIAWRMTRPNCVSVARRTAVAELDRHVGPKS